MKYELQPGDQVNHKVYGSCKVIGFAPLLGVIMEPVTPEGKQLLGNLPLLECEPAKNIEPFGVARVRGLVSRMRAAGL